jgi:hypothetical protein
MLALSFLSIIHRPSSLLPSQCHPSSLYLTHFFFFFLVSSLRNFLSVSSEFLFCHHHSSLPHFSFPCFFDLPSLLPLSVFPFLSCWLTTPSRSIISSFSFPCDFSKSSVVFHCPIFIDFREFFLPYFVSHFSVIFYYLSPNIIHMYTVHTFPNVLEL